MNPTLPDLATLLIGLCPERATLPMAPPGPSAPVLATPVLRWTAPGPAQPLLDSRQE